MENYYHGLFRTLPNAKYCLVLIDQRSRYPIVAFATSTNAASLIKVLENVFAQYGLFDRVTTDNRSPLRQKMLKTILKVIEYIIKQ